MFYHDTSWDHQGQRLAPLSRRDLWQRKQIQNRLVRQGTGKVRLSIKKAIGSIHEFVEQHFRTKEYLLTRGQCQRLAAKPYKGSLFGTLQYSLQYVAHAFPVTERVTWTNCPLYGSIVVYAESLLEHLLYLGLDQTAAKREFAIILEHERAHIQHANLHRPELMYPSIERVHARDTLYRSSLNEWDADVHALLNAENHFPEMQLTQEERDWLLQNRILPGGIVYMPKHNKVLYEDKTLHIVGLFDETLEL